MLMAEFHTAAEYDLPVKVVINNNNELGMILWEQMVLGYPEYGVRFREPMPDYAAWARGCGGFGVRVPSPGISSRRCVRRSPIPAPRWSTWR
jgi:pyruvate dehydrogenase (quinone)/pyruvate oxidase